MTTLDLRLTASQALVDFYRLATSDADGFICRLGSLRLSFEDAARAPREIWRDRHVACCVRRLLADMPALPLLVALDSPAAVWLPLCMHNSGVAALPPGRAEIELQVFDRLFERMGRNLAPLAGNLALSLHQVAVVNAHLRRLRHHLLSEAHNC